MSAQSDSGEAGSSQLRELAAAIDRNADVPIGLQLAWALSARINDGRFEPGQRLPGLRELAETVGVNANTVRSVYQRLEHEGLIESRQGSGTFAAATLPRHSAASAIAAAVAREAHAFGIHPREVATALYVTPTPSPTAAPSATATPSSRPAEETAERRRQLRAQIAALERAIGKMEVEHPGLAPPAPGGLHGPGPALLSAEELEEVRSQLVRRLGTVQAAIDRLRAEASAATTPTVAPDPAATPAADTATKDPSASVPKLRKSAGQRQANARPAPAGA